MSFFTGSHNSQVQLWKCGQNYRALEPLFNVTVVGSYYLLCFPVGYIFEQVFKLIRQIIYSYHNSSLEISYFVSWSTFSSARVCQQYEVFKLWSILGGRSWTGAQVTELMIMFP